MVGSLAEDVVEAGEKKMPERKVQAQGESNWTGGHEASNVFQQSADNSDVIEECR